MATKKLTTKDLLRVFAVTPMTIHLWRKGTATRSPLPTSSPAGKRPVFFSAAKIKQWAEKNGVTIVLDPLGLESDDVKPGPKPKALAAEV